MKIIKLYIVVTYHQKYSTNKSRMNGCVDLYFSNIHTCECDMIPEQMNQAETNFATKLIINTGFYDTTKQLK